MIKNSNKKASYMFSIVSVCLNPGPDIKKTVESVTNQKFYDYELLIKDGCSTDGTCNIQWKDNRIRFLSFQDKGIFDAMNQALALCRGKYVIFMNVGDQFADLKVLRYFASEIEKYPEAEFFYGDVYKHQSRTKINFYPDHLSRFYIFTRMICHQCWCVKRSTYLSYGGFETDFLIGSDIRLFVMMIGRDRLQYRHICKIVAIYKGGGQSADPELIKKSMLWVEDIKKQVFSDVEYFVYNIVWRIWLTIKPYIYDNFISLPLKLIKTLKAGMQI